MRSDRVRRGFGVLMLSNLWMFACGVAPSCQGQQDPDAMQILQRTASAYKSLSSYEFRVNIQTVHASDVAERHLHEVGSGTTEYLIEDASPDADLLVSDGQTEWRLNRARNEFAKSTVSPESVTPISDFARIDQHVREAHINREELFGVDGKPTRLYVVEVVPDVWPKETLKGAEFVMYHIDEKSFIVREAITHSADSAEIVSYNILKWNEPMDYVRFAFAPPPGAREVNSVGVQRPVVTKLIGTMAPDFTLQDIAGKPVSLQNMRGKVVIVDFWASWCGPCRALTPLLQKMNADFANQGLVVLGLNVGEDADTVSEYAKEAQVTFSLLLGSQPETAERYHVDAFPTTVVIDRQGRIVYHEDGLGSPAQLVSAVRDALGKGK